MTTLLATVDNGNNPTYSDKPDRVIKGRPRFTVFLPHINNAIGYDNTNTIAIYNYTMEWKDIDPSTVY